MLTIWNHVSAFTSVILLNCFTPANWSHCLEVNQWLPPYVSDLKEFYCDKPYEMERRQLDKF